MKLIAGLGNPGSKYERTKHNVGFITIDELAHRHGFLLNKSKFEADYGEVFIQGEKVLFVKPQTYMNESGRAILPLLDYYGIPDEDLLVIYDEMDLEPGKIRLRKKGSAGGHNGMKSIISYLGSQDFKRLRIGVGRPQFGMSVVQHVLSPFHEKDQEDATTGVLLAADAVEHWLAGNSFEETMTQYN